MLLQRDPRPSLRSFVKTLWASDGELGPGPAPHRSGRGDIEKVTPEEMQRRYDELMKGG